LQQQQYRKKVLQLWLLEMALPALLGAEGLTAATAADNGPASLDDHGEDGGFVAAQGAPQAHPGLQWQQRGSRLWHRLGATATPPPAAGSSWTDPADLPLSQGQVSRAAESGKWVRQLLRDFPAGAAGLEPGALSKQDQGKADATSVIRGGVTVPGAGEQQGNGVGEGPSIAVAAEVVDKVTAAAALGAGGSPAAHVLDVWMDPLPHPCLHQGFKAKYKRVVYDGVVPEPPQVS
jgi:hypothetical protein